MVPLGFPLITVKQVHFTCTTVGVRRTRDAPLISRFREGSVTKDEQQEYIYLQFLTGISVRRFLLLASLPFYPDITTNMNSNICTPNRNSVTFNWQDFGESNEDEDDDEDLKPFNLFSYQHR